MTRPRLSLLSGIVLLLGMLTTLFAKDPPTTGVPVKTPVAAPAAEPTPEPMASPEMRPYRVLIRVMVSRDTGLNSPPQAQELHQQLASALERIWGDCWQIQVQQETRLQPAERQQLEQVSPDWFLTTAADNDLEKQFLVQVDTEGGLYRLAAREWDVAAQSLSAVSLSDPLERRALPEQGARLIADLFRPWLVIDDVQGTTVRVRPWGGIYHLPDADLDCFPENSLWIPFYHISIRNEQGKQEERVQFIPWTYLRLGSAAHQAVFQRTADLVTGLKNPIAQRRSSQVKTLAISTRPLRASTRLLLRAKDKGGIPLAGFEVDLMTDEKTVQRTLLTDRSGGVLLTPEAEHPLIWFRARSGPQRLARLPVVPGAVSELVLDLPRDDLRLKTEARIALLQAQLMDTVARRAALMNRVKRLSNQGDWKLVDPLVSELNALPSKDSLQAELTVIRVSAVTAAQKANDRIAVKRIEKMYEETKELLDHYLDEDKLKQLLEEVEVLRKAAKKDADLLKEVTPPAKKGE